MLLREGQKFFVFSKVSSLEGSNGGEGPAWAAVSLILDWGYTTSLNPVDVVGRIVLDEVDGLNTWLMVLTWRRFEAKDSLILGVCPVGELVVSEFKVLGPVAAIVLVDHLVVINESF